MHILCSQIAKMSELQGDSLQPIRANPGRNCALGVHQDYSLAFFVSICHLIRVTPLMRFNREYENVKTKTRKCKYFVEIKNIKIRNIRLPQLSHKLKFLQENITMRGHWNVKKIKMINETFALQKLYASIMFVVVIRIYTSPKVKQHLNVLVNVCLFV